MGFSLRVSGVNLGVSGHCNVEQLVSPDCYPMHLKGVVAFCKSTIPLCLNALIVMSPYGLVAVADPFQFSLSQEATFDESTGSLYPLPVFFWVVCTVTLSVSEHVMLSPEAMSISKSASSSLDESESDETCGIPQASWHRTIIKISSGSGWTGRGAGKFLPLLLFKAEPSFW